MTDQEKIDNLHKILGRKRTEIKNLKAQLAREQEAGKEIIAMHRDAVIKCNEARDQLAAEQGLHATNRLAMGDAIKRLQKRLTL
jgi:predicted translin family RNA/ssDNA-binding protein